MLLLGAAADATSGLMLPGLDITLGAADVASLALVATALGSSGSLAFDFKKALDNDDTAAEPALGGSL